MSTASSPTTPSSTMSVHAAQKAGDVFSTPVTDNGYPADRSPPSHSSDEEGDEESGEFQEGESTQESNERLRGPRGKAQATASKRRHPTSSTPLPTRHTQNSGGSRAHNSSHTQNSDRRYNGRPSGGGRAHGSPHVQGSSHKPNHSKDHKGGCVVM